MSERRITKITVGRLYNLGNYEHVRFELQVEIIDEDALAGEVMSDICQCLDDINPTPPHSSWDLKRARAFIEKPEANQVMDVEERKAYIAQNIVQSVKVIAECEAWEKRREDAFVRFDGLGGTFTHKDAK